MKNLSCDRKINIWGGGVAACGKVTGMVHTTVLGCLSF